MSKRKPVQIVEDYSPPQALIIDGGPIAHPLSDSLSEYGCQIVASEQTGKISGRYDYIFQFDNSTFVGIVIDKHLKTNGKFLLIITNKTEPFKFITPPSVKILKIGNVDLWDKKELIGKIFKAMFSTQKTKILDLWKGSSMPYKTPLLSIPPKKTAQTAKPSLHISPTPPPIMQKTFLKKRLFLLGLFLLVMSLSICGSAYWYATSVKKVFSNFQTHFAAGDLNGLTSDLKEVKKKLKLAQTTYDLTYKILIPFRETSFMQETGSFLLTSNNLLAMGEDALLMITDKQVLFSSPGFSDPQKK